MRVFLWCLLGFIVSAVIGYSAVILSYLTWSNVFHGYDPDGGAAMGAVFFIGPAAGLLCGLIGSLACGLREAARVDA